MTNLKTLEKRREKKLEEIKNEKDPIVKDRKYKTLAKINRMIYRKVKVM